MQYNINAKLEKKIDKSHFGLILKKILNIVNRNLIF